MKKLSSGSPAGPLLGNERGFTFSEALQKQNFTRIYIGIPTSLYFSIAYVRDHHWLLSSFAEMAIASTSFWYILYVIAAEVYATRCRPSGNNFVPMCMAVADPFFLTVGLIFTGYQSHYFFTVYAFVNLSYGFRYSHRAMLWHAFVSSVCILFTIFYDPDWARYRDQGYEWIILLIANSLYARSLINQSHSRRMKAEEAGIQAREEARAISALLAKVSHELRTPLTGIVAATEMIKSGRALEQTKEYADTILSLSRDLLSEINELLDFTRIEQDATWLQPESVNMAAFLDNVSEGFSVMAAEKGLVFDVIVDDRLKDNVLVDRKQLKTMLQNILGNAFKFTERGRIVLEVQVRDQSETHYELEFVVDDTGIGIAKEHHAKIFDRFYQVSEGPARRYTGSGLGMSLAQNIARKMGGRIEVDSEIGTGSRFSFRLDLPRGKTMAPSEPLPDMSTLQPGPALTPSPRRVLVVEDNPTNQLMIKSFLRMDGHHVDTAANGTEALEMLARGSYDTIFMDYNMPDMDGIDVFEFYCSNTPEERRASVYFLTADASVTSRELLLATGCAGLLYKPFTQPELRRAMKGHPQGWVEEVAMKSSPA